MCTQPVHRVIVLSLRISNVGFSGSQVVVLGTDISSLRFLVNSTRERERERETETETDRDRHRERQRERQTDRQRQRVFKNLFLINMLSLIHI